VGTAFPHFLGACERVPTYSGFVWSVMKMNTSLKTDLKMSLKCFWKWLDFLVRSHISFFSTTPLCHPDKCHLRYCVFHITYKLPNSVRNIALRHADECEFTKRLRCCWFWLLIFAMVRTRKVALCKYRKLISAVGDNKERIKESNAKQVTLRGITKSATHNKLRVTFCGIADKCFHSLLSDWKECVGWC